MDVPPLGSMRLPAATPAPTRLLPTLTEFLLARIAEDETNPRGFGAIPMDPDTFAAKVPPRILAECEAKRQRVGILDEMERDEDNRLSSYAYSLQCREALPYAHHPDYREEWRA